MMRWPESPFHGRYSNFARRHRKILPLGKPWWDISRYKVPDPPYVNISEHLRSSNISRNATLTPILDPVRDGFEKK